MTLLHRRNKSDLIAKSQNFSISAGRTGRPWLFVTVLLLLVITVSGVQAQTPATTLESLTVDIWPDFDRPSVLVLLTGTIPDDTGLPATVTIPLPEDATLNAVARIDAAGGMFSDMEIDDSVPGRLTLTAAEPQFRIEYYVPYQADGDDREFSFDWRSDLTVEEMKVSIQQPASATTMSVDPEPAEVIIGRFGLPYHNQEPQAVAPGEGLSLAVFYNMAQPQLTTEFLDAQEAVVTGGSEPEGGVSFLESDGFNWPMVLVVAGVLVIIGVVTWLVLDSRGQRRVTKPRPARPTSSPKSGQQPKFCHECGQSLDPDDRFCRNCGTAVKGT